MGSRDTAPGRGDNEAGVELESGHGHGLEKSLELPGALEVDGWERGVCSTMSLQFLADIRGDPGALY